MFFAGRLPRPPWETRSRVEAMVKRLDRMHIQQLRRPLPVHDAAVALSRRSWISGIAGCGRARKDGRVRSRQRPPPEQTPQTARLIAC